MNRLLNINSKKHLDRLLQAVKYLRPSWNNNTNWKELTQNQRRASLSTFFSFQDFDEKEIKYIEKYVFRIVVPVRLIIMLTLILVVLFVAFKYYNFSKLARIYAIGNNVPVFVTTDSVNQAVISQLDLYGKTSDSAHRKTEYSMILIRETDSIYIVQSDNFFEWLFGEGSDQYVMKEQVVTDESEYQMYEEIFNSVKKLTFLDQLTLIERKAILNCIKSDNQYFQSVITHNLYDDDIQKGRKPFVTAKGPDGEDYVFLSLKKSNGTIINGKMILKDGRFQRLTEISYLKKTFDTAVKWLKRQDSQQAIPFIGFIYKLDTYESLVPPYETFYKK